MQLFHGTTHNFDSFDVNKAFGLNHVGKGIYLTTCYDDALCNYAGYGPDLRNRVSTMIDDLMNEDENLAYDDAEKIAKEKLIGGGRFMLKCEIDPTFKFLKLGKFYIELYEYCDDEDDEDAEPTETIYFKALLKACEETGYDFFSISAECDLTTTDIFNHLCNQYQNVSDEYPGECFRLFVLYAGYDGVEYEDAYAFFRHMVKRNTKHFVSYRNEAVKIIEKEILS